MYSDILLATGGEAASDRATDHAIELAAHHDATLHVLFVVDSDVYDAYSGDEYVDEREGPEHGLEEVGEEAVETVAERAREAGVDVEPTIRHGRPPETIVDVARAVGADLVVMGTRRRPDEYRSLLGSVTDRVLRLAEMPVTVIKTPVE
ncbi:universal stress protein [Halobellus clavatus]|jgi:nucleotide-binding universal stress UspA family protein|uniref:Nucleotide-binding universal stress protein, UspA family n=1 Tax=Halobellus clavatus TaxID=660517 RepID=A0A1H3KQ13_9EURY|nr:universal stress protein [Halobellus clavatus]SDY54109.1 Nucleotide-binding universal stress protein, UspA family [Halobellus clavatus]